jgi:signal transduction histidine kinase
VTDNGAGFDVAHAQRLFKPFTRLHRQDEFPGHGLGLATVQRIVQRHGGEVAAVAEVNRGATVRFWLPDSPD